MSRPVETGTATRTRNSRKHKTIRELIDLIIHQGKSSELLDCNTRQLLKRCPNLETLGIDFTEKKAFRAFNQFWTELKIDIKAGTLVLFSVSSSAAQEPKSRPTTRTHNSRNHKTIRELIDVIIRQGESSELLNCTTRQLIERCPNLETSLDIDFTEKKQGAYRAFHQFWTELKIDIKAGKLGVLSSSSSAAAQEAQPQSLSSSAAEEPAQSNLS
jgi:hypothetical protein